jgi:hypothetical protein
VSGPGDASVELSNAQQGHISSGLHLQAMDWEGERKQQWG